MIEQAISLRQKNLITLDDFHTIPELHTPIATDTKSLVIGMCPFQ